MLTANEHPVVHVLEDKRIIKKLKRSLAEAERDETVGLEYAHNYWMHRIQEKRGASSFSSFLSGIFLPATIAALLGSIVFKYLETEEKQSTRPVSADQSSPAEVSPYTNISKEASSKVGSSSSVS